MSNETVLSSRRGNIPCGDKDLYLFLTDMRNFATVIPQDHVTHWQANEDSCSFRIDKAGKINAELLEALPFSQVSYRAETFLTGAVAATVNIESVDHDRSVIFLTVRAKLNPLMKMMLGDKPEKYLDEIISAIESYDGYDRIRKDNRSL